MELEVEHRGSAVYYFHLLRKTDRQDKQTDSLHYPTMHLPLLTLSISLSLYHTTLATPLLSTRGNDAPKPVNTTTCNTQTYTYTSLAGFGKLPSDIRDKYGDTIGVGSAIAIDKSSVRCRKTKKNNKNKSIYEGIIYGLPDRGWNTQGTQNTQARIHRFGFTFDSSVVGTSKEPAQPNFELRYEDTILLTGPDGKALTGLDPTGSVEVKGFGVLPVATCMFVPLCQYFDACLKSTRTVPETDFP